MDYRVTAVLVAAGSSTRMGFDKLSFDLGGETVLERSVRAFDECPEVDELVLVTGASGENAERAAARCKKPVQLVRGGATRAESARNGVAAAHGVLVAVHDAARPFVSGEVIAAVLKAAARCGAAAPAVPVKDTIKQAKGGSGKTVPAGCMVEDTPDRSTLYAVQTPQCFDRTQYLAALQEAAQAGVKVVLVDTDVETSFQHLYVGTDNYAAGRMLGQALIAETGGEANVMIMSGDEGYPNLDERIRGLRDEVADCEGIRIAGVKYDKYDSLNVLKQYQSILGNYPLVDTIVGVEGTLCMALGPYVNLEEPHMKVVLGFDRCAEADAGLDRGVITGVITQDNEEMGRQAIQMLMQWLETGRLEHSCYYTATSYFTSADYRREQEVKAHG